MAAPTVCACSRVEAEPCTSPGKAAESCIDRAGESSVMPSELRRLRSVVRQSFVSLCFTALVGAAGCVKILGDFTYADDGCSEEGALRCQGDDSFVCTGSTWHKDATCPFLCNEGAGCVGQCKPKSTQCEGDRLLTCTDDANWGPPAPCSFLCDKTHCAGECKPNAVQCKKDSPTIVQTCDQIGKWKDGSACPFACNNGACVGDCVPGAKRCDNRQYQTCNTAGVWVNEGDPCIMSLCTTDTPHCTGTCEPNSTRCSGTTVQTCVAGTNWVNAATPCQYVCLGRECTGECTPGQTQCVGTSAIRTCNAAGQYETSACPNNICRANVCAGDCSPGTLRCNMTRPERCDDTGAWVAAAPTCSYVCDMSAVATKYCIGICHPGMDKKCNGLTKQICDSRGNYVSNGNCTTSCVGGECK